MRIVFICGSLEEGRDGVGDYTRRIAGELSRQGHQASIIALNDPYINVACEEVQQSGAVGIKTLRIPAKSKRKQCIRDAKNWVDDFNTKWLSLQFVPYAFDKKGMPAWLGKALKKIGGERPWHIMFHELWLGTSSLMNFKLLITSAIQKKIIKQITRDLKPAKIHTHLPAFLSKLESLDLKAEMLPLFSNISGSAQKTGMNGSSGEGNEKILTIGFFSQADAGSSVLDFLTSFYHIARLEGMQMKVLLIGGDEKQMMALKLNLENIAELKVSVHYTGFLSTTEVSRFISMCSLGVTSVPRHALGKSGSVAAFLAHGIPVAAPNVHAKYDASEIGFSSSISRQSVLLKPDIAQLRIAKQAAITAMEQVSLSSIAKKFISALEYNCL